MTSFNPEQQLLAERRKAIVQQLSTMNPGKAQDVLTTERQQIEALLGKAYRKGGAEAAYGAAYGIGGINGNP